MSIVKSLKSIGRKALLLHGRKFPPLLGPEGARLCYASPFSTASTIVSSRADFQKQGLLDNEGLTVFNTLHELQEVACSVYSENELFGTFNDSSGQFEYLTYGDFGKQVEECRALLRHLGK
jgi:hypothetical protein